MVPCSVVAESNVVVIAVPFSVITSPLTKPMPVAARVKSGLPAAMEEGDIDVRLNVCDPDPVTVSCIGPEVVVSDFITRILTVPAAAICAADIEVVSWVVETTLVARATASHNICVPLVKFVPVAVSVNPALPAATVAGEIEVSVGVTTPLKPPHPMTNVKRTSKTDKQTGLDTRIFDFGLSGQTVVQTS